jgi:hypothetical protein
MSRKLVALATCIGALAIPAAASAAPEDFASGAGDLSFPGRLGPGHISFTGHGTPTDAHGQIHIDIPGSVFFESLKGKVNCVFVNGNEANLSGELTRGPAGPPAPRFFVLFVRDNGNPSGATRDQADVAVSFDSPISCVRPSFAFSPFFHGNAVVKDNTP